MRAFNILMIASLNRGKQDEFRALLQKHNLNLGAPEEFVRNALFLNHVEHHTENTTYFDNAKRKCEAAFYAAKVPTFADDSGLEIDALHGKPGIASALHNSKQILEKLKGAANRKARFRCVIVFMLEGVLLRAEGLCEGSIANEARGDSGFGFDDIFMPEAGNGRTFAEMRMEEKNTISHRKHAVDDLLRQMQERDIQLVRP